MKKITLAFVLMAGVSMLSCTSGTPKLGKASIDKVIAAMTPEEKVHLLIGTGMEGFSSGDSAVVGETKNLVPGAAGTTYPVPRLGIPSVVLADGPAGLRISPTREGDEATYYCTHFPIGTLLACTWDTDLVENVGKEVSYPFGYGLSYSTFEYGKPSVNLVNGVYKVNVEVRNSGNVAGREVVELYAASPDSKSADRPLNLLTR